jgi:protein-disulfide isomerase
MHDGIYENQDSLGAPLLLALIKALRLPEEEWREALLNERYAAKVKSDFLSGVRSGVNATPSFFVNGQQHLGSYAFEDLVAAIDVNLPARARL